MTRVRVEPRLCDQDRRENDAFTHIFQQKLTERSIAETVRADRAIKSLNVCDSTKACENASRGISL